MKIILIGFMGCGKTSLAKKLASLLQWPVIEMDELVYQKTDCTCMHEVFAKGGELLLRETEITIAREHALVDKHIISTGGGAVLNKIVIDYLKQNGGQVFFLNAPFLTLADRLSSNTTRPLFNNTKETEALYCFRQPLYLKYADHIIDVEHKTLNDMAEDIIALLCRNTFKNWEISIG